VSRKQDFSPKIELNGVKPIPKECKALPAKVPESNENPASEAEISGAFEARPLAPKTVYPAVL
jgi:hypothetical protein